MKTYAVYFRPRGALSSPLGSDTLFGAICWGIQVLRLVPDLAQWLTANSQPPFAVSGLFPVEFHQRGDHRRYFPRPMNFAISPDDIDQLAGDDKLERKKLAGKAKKFNRIAYLSEADTLKFARGQLAIKDFFKQFDAGKDEVVRLRSNPVQHNHVDRLAGGTVEGLLFYENETYFARGTGLWAMLRCEQSVAERYIIPALRYLADTGLGSNRSTGKGHFDIEVLPEPEPPKSKQPNAVMMLSRYLPWEKDEINLDTSLASYRLTTIRARRESKFVRVAGNQATPPIYKRAVRMFEPGAVFQVSAVKELYGRVSLVVSQDEGGPVYQSGVAIPFPLQIKEG